MLSKEKIKNIAFENGADLFGVASVDRFDNAPMGFHPKDVYSKVESIIAFAIRIPTESLYAESPIPYTHVNMLATSKVDAITYGISSDLDRLGVKNVVVPSDNPYLSWDNINQVGKGIISLRHAGYLAGLGKLGKNNLLINKDFGNMIQIGALLTSIKYESDPLADYEVCPLGCTICLDICPQFALDGETVIQKYCRPLSNYESQKGFIIKKCFECRKNCPHVFGLKE